MKTTAIMLGLAAATCFPATAPAQEEADSPEALFQSLDENKDGQLASEEISKEQSRFFDRLVRIGDENDDGRLSREEFLAALTREDAPVGANSEDRTNRPRAIPIADLFERFDADNNGKISLDELPEQARERMRPLFNQFGKEELTREDFETIRDRYARREMDAGRMQQILQRMDRNGDGKLHRDELPEQARGPVRQLFDRLDTDSIALDDLAEKLQAMNPARDGRRDPANPRGRRPSAEDSDRADRSRDRRPPPILQVLDTDGQPGLSKEELAAAADKFEELDRNGDGRLDPPELFGAPPQDRPRPDDRPRRPSTDEASKSDRPRQREFDVDAFISRFDKNDDDAVSEDEAPERMKENFSRIDADGDGKLTREEIAKVRAQRPQQQRKNPIP